MRKCFTAKTRSLGKSYFNRFSFSNERHYEIAFKSNYQLKLKIIPKRYI